MRTSEVEALNSADSGIDPDIALLRNLGKGHNSSSPPPPKFEQFRRAEEALQNDINTLKDPLPYRRRFETDLARQLSRAIDILWRLEREAYDDASRVGFEKLRDAKLYLDQRLKDYFVEHATE